MNKEASINIGYLNRYRYFSIDEASSLLPLVMQITKTLYYEIERHDEILSHHDLSSLFLQTVENDKQYHIHSWKLKLKKIGLYSFKLGNVCFDTGRGYLTWQYPQSSIQSFLHYESTFDCKIPLQTIMFSHRNWLYPQKNIVNKQINKHLVNRSFEKS